MPLLTPNFSQQAHARMNYLRAMGKLRSEKAAIMLKFILKILLSEK